MSTTILLADDSITIQKVVGIIFANEEFDLVVVDNGSAALEKARDIHPAVMLVDALMPGKSGYEVCEEVRRDPILANTPLLLLVGAFEPFDEDRARTSGADDFITKPFESQNLIDKVKMLVELAATRTAAAPAPVEEPHPEVAPHLEDVALQPVGTSAGLADSFRSFVHLGAETVPEQETVGAAVTVSSPEPVAPPVAEPEPQSVILLSSVDIVEASADDDLWGSFAEEIPEDETVHFGEVVEETGQEEISDAVEEIEPFTLMDEEPAAIPMEKEPVSVAMEPDSIQEATFGYDTFLITGREERPVFEEAPESPESEEIPSERIAESHVASESISLGEEPATMVTESRVETFESPVSLEEPSEPFGFVQEEVDLQFAPEDEYVPVTEAFADREEPSVSAVAPVEQAPVTISEAQLAEAISRISREIIEKIAWDVVPDLAESIIKEEIRKIKEGMAR
jgi:CheY-like chemotaxis protein